MRFALTTSAKLPFGFERRVSINYSRRDLSRQNFSGRPRSFHRPVSTVYSIKASAGDYLTKYSSCLHNLTDQILDASPQAIKEFPWEKAKLIVEQRLLVLGRNALTWSLAGLFIFSFVYDALLAIFVRRELVVPLGLYIGVLLADFSNESCRELFESKAKHDARTLTRERIQTNFKWKLLQRLWGIGLFFVALRFIYLRFRMPGWVLFSHIGNGGLMQTLWLAKEMKQPEIIQNKEEVDALKHTRD